MKKDYRLKSESVDFSNPIFKNNSRLHQTVFPKQFKDDMLYSKLYRDINRKNNSRISKNHLPNLSNSNNNIPLNTENSPLISTHKTFIPENVDSVLKTAHNFVNKSPFKNRLNVDVNKIIKEDEKERNVLITPCKNYESTNNKDKFSKERINDLHKLENINKKKEKIVRKTQNQFYCPFCEHCNKFEDPFFDNYIFSINEAKNFLSKSVEYIVNSGIITKENLDFFESSSSNIMQENAPKEKKISQNDASLISKNQTKEIETFINAIPKSIVNSRSTYTILSHFLNALIEDKLSLDYIASPDIMNKLNDSLISVGYSFIEVNNTLEFDKELETLFDERTMKMIKKLFESLKIINYRKTHKNGDSA